MAVKSQALTTLTNFKTALGISGSGDDTKIEQIIDRATAWIESKMDRKLKARRYNNGGSTHGTTGVTDEDYIYFSGSLKDHGGDTVYDRETGHGIFHLPAWPIRPNAETNSVTFALASLSSRSSSGESWDTSLTELDHYIVDRERGILRLIGPFAPGYRNYRITCAAGYLTGAAQPYVPDDLEALCIELARSVYKDDRDVTSESIGTWSRTFSAALKQADPMIQDAFAKYTRFSL